MVVQIVTFVVAFALAASRILNASKALWSLLPPVLSGILPSLVVAIPALGEAVAGAQSWTDLTVAFLTAGALLVPGTHSHTVEITKPNGPGSSALALLLAICAAFSTSACGTIKWPAVAHCVPSKDELFIKVSNILLGGGDYAAALEQLAKTEGAEAVACAVSELVDQLSSPTAKPTAARTAAVAHGKSFLAEVGTKVESAQ